MHVTKSRPTGIIWRLILWVETHDTEIIGRVGHHNTRFQQRKYRPRSESKVIIKGRSGHENTGYVIRPCLEHGVDGHPASARRAGTLVLVADSESYTSTKTILVRRAVDLEIQHSRLFGAVMYVSTGSMAVLSFATGSLVVAPSAACRE